MLGKLKNLNLKLSFGKRKKEKVYEAKVVEEESLKLPEEAERLIKEVERLSGRSINREQVLARRRTTPLSLPEILITYEEVPDKVVAKAIASLYGLEYQERINEEVRVLGEVLYGNTSKRKYHFLPLPEVNVIIPKGIYDSYVKDTSLKVSEENVWSKFLTILLQAKRKGDVEDIIITPVQNTYEVRFKYVGDLGARTEEILTYEEGDSMINAIMVHAGLLVSREDEPQSGVIRLPDMGLELRVEVIKTVYGKSATMRVIETAGFFTQTLSSLGYPEEVKKRIMEKAKATWGLILVSGPTGSGKSTLISAILNELKEIYTRHGKTLVIKTIEDPVERIIRGADHVQRKEGVLEFADAVKSFLRQNPDIIVVGEVRDPETAHLVIRSARTGHLTFSTIHASSSIDALLRFKDELQKAGETEVSIGHIFASNLLMSLNLRLIRGKNGEKYPVVEIFVPDDEDRQRLARGEYWEIYSKMKERKETFEYQIMKLFDEGKIDKETAEAYLGHELNYTT